MEATPFVAVLADAIAQADRRGGGLRIEQLHDGWETSIAVDRRRIAIARDEYLEAALRRLTAHAESPGD